MYVNLHTLLDFYTQIVSARVKLASFAGGIRPNPAESCQSKEWLLFAPVNLMDESQFHLAFFIHYYVGSCLYFFTRHLNPCIS